MRPNDATPVGAGADIKSPLEKQDTGNLTDAPLPRKSLHCIYCNSSFERRAGGDWSEMLCEPCENGQPEVFHLGGGDE